MNIGEAFYCSRPLEEEGKCTFCGYDPSFPYQGPQLEEGTFLREGRYQLGAVIGRGGFGITYAAWNSVLELPVAVMGDTEAGYKLAYNYFSGYGGDEKFREDLDMNGASGMALWMR